MHERSSPIGTDLNTKSWLTEAYRTMCNNLDPDVAEHPQEFVVYGGIGRCVWLSFSFSTKFSITLISLVFTFFATELTFAQSTTCAYGTNGSVSCGRKATMVK